MHRKLLAAALMLCTALVSFSQTMYTPSTEECLNKTPKVPKMIVFAGDTIRFDRRDMYERMDRELISFCYMHSNSTLMYKKSKRIFEEVVPILKLHGVPEDLKYLMAIESNLEVRSLSTSGAAGLWQFMKASGKEYGLVIDEEVDERYNIEKSTIAACSYMKKMYRKYGDWMAVAAAYNGGPNGLEKKMTDQKQKNVFDLWMVEETSRYMYRVLAAKIFFSNPAAFGFDLSPADRYEYVPPKETVSVSGPVPSLVDFAIEHGVTYKQLKEANLWLRDNKLVNKNGRTYSVRIPDVTK